MPLPQNTKRIFRKYDTSSYSPECATYFQTDEVDIVCVIVNEKERNEANKNLVTLMEDFFNKDKKHSSIRGAYKGDSLIEFEKFLSKYFKLKIK